MTPNITIPNEIIAACRKVEDWMLGQGETRNWELCGICSRDHAHTLRRVREALNPDLSNAVAGMGTPVLTPPIPQPERAP